jgi:hypothetical protein
VEDWITRRIREEAERHANLEIIQQCSDGVYADLWAAIMGEAEKPIAKSHFVPQFNGSATHRKVIVGEKRLSVSLSEEYGRWLAPADPAQLPVDLLKPFPAEEMKAWPVSQDVGNVRNNRPELVEPVQSG